MDLQDLPLGYDPEVELEGHIVNLDEEISTELLDLLVPFEQKKVDEETCASVQPSCNGDFGCNDLFVSAASSDLVLSQGYNPQVDVGSFQILSSEFDSLKDLCIGIAMLYLNHIMFIMELDSFSQFFAVT